MLQETVSILQDNTSILQDNTAITINNFFEVGTKLLFIIIMCIDKKKKVILQLFSQSITSAVSWTDSLICICFYLWVEIAYIYINSTYDHSYWVAEVYSNLFCKLLWTESQFIFFFTQCTHFWEHKFRHAQKTCDKSASRIFKIRNAIMNACKQAENEIQRKAKSHKHINVCWILPN